MALTTGQGVTGELAVTSYRAAVVHRFDQPLAIEQVTPPPLKQGQIRVKIEVCGPCHTDILAAHGDWQVKPTPPFTPGHEDVGPVTELGPGVTEVVLGAHVAMPRLGYACGICDYCISGWETLRERQEMMGYTIDGGFGEYATAFARYVVHVPDGVESLDAAPLSMPRSPAAASSRSTCSTTSWSSPASSALSSPSTRGRRILSR